LRRHIRGFGFYEMFYFFRAVKICFSYGVVKIVVTTKLEI